MEFKHPYLPMTEETEKEMLHSIGRENLDELFKNIPDRFRLQSDLDLPESHSEPEIIQRLSELSATNHSAVDGHVFLGGGLGIHFIPRVVSALASRSEFLTAYTSYQPEISQGMLQTLFEYQSFLAEILEIDVVNSSMYDMASAVAEAVLMASRVKKGRKWFLVPRTINPAHLRVIETYAEPVGITVETLDFDTSTGLLTINDLQSKMDEKVAGVYLENPSYLGTIETQVEEIAHIVHQNGSLLVAGVDLLSLGLLRPPGDYGADIVVAEGQGLGIPMSYGGPLLGVFGCRDEMKIIRQLPGRLVGMTQTIEEPHEQGFVLTLSPREQHIRRERATSNICSNQALMAVTAAIHMAHLGPTGLRQLSETVAYKSHYAASRLNAIQGVTAPAIGESFWKDFVVRFETGVTAQEVHDALRAQGVHGGKILTRESPSLGECMLMSVTEVHTREAIDTLIQTIEQFVNGGVA